MTYTAWFDEIRKDDIALAGGKGANLGELSHAGLPVPAGFVLTTTAYDAFVEANSIEEAILGRASVTRADDPAVFEEIAEAIRALFSGGKVPEEMADEILAAYQKLSEDAVGTPVAARSSATAEDLPGMSFAGQQETYLNIRGAEALLDGVKNCWASLWTARAMAYRARQSVDPATVSLAVVVQRMVESEAAGVMFTANPANGRRDQATISAAWGLGESVVSGSVTPDSIVVEKQSGRVLSRETSDKQVMTVYSESGTEERPVPEARRCQPVLDDGAAAELARYGKRIEVHYGIPQDIEWALAGGEFFIVQSRPITALPEPMADPPTDWSVPDPKGFYVRASIVEQMPDPLSPLFADLANRSVPRSLDKLMNELLGSGTLREGELAFPTVNGYAYYYYKMAAILRISAKALAVLPSLYGRGKASGVKRWREFSHPRYATIVKEWEAKPPEDLPAVGLLAGARELLDAGTEYYTSVQTIIPIAATSEMLFTGFYDRLIRREGDPPGQIFLLGFDSMPIRAEKSLYDLAMWCGEHPELAATLLDTPSHRALELLRMEVPPAGMDERVWTDWRSRFQTHLDRYGHAVYNLDFVNPVPADDPAPLFDTLKFYLRGQGQNPHQRQRTMVRRREEGTRALLERLDPARGRLIGWLLRWAQAAAPVREDALADTGLAWPLMRGMLLELGRRLVEAGALEIPADVFWLRWDELEDRAGSLDAGETQLASLADPVEQRKMLWRGQRRVTPPQLLPKRTWFKVFEGLMPAASEDQTGDTIKGIAASGGQVTAAARVLGGPGDFGQMRPGEVLVAAITTPAWTSLFAMASAVVTDVGGPLSHSSIVAREYGIPAVLGTGVATRRIRSEQNISVDGDAGTVTLLDGMGRDDGGRPAEVASEPAASSMAGKLVLAALAVVVLIAAFARRRRRKRT
ncbi:MAG TPA: PEP/pyruvate-binding domain-containing protein [Rubrobacter sp.]|nr:PEP/pyruvate-binding domain-containing protein [Rubrobacter sp.]